MEVQVAFQGGGARVAALLAAAHALRDLQSAGKLRVTRVAGSSAGAIAAVLFASGADLDKVREKLLKRGDKGIGNLFPVRPSWRQFWITARGNPLYDVGKLRTLLKDLLEGYVDDETELGELKPPALITVTDAASGKKRVLQDDDPVLRAVVDSSGLPFVFREAGKALENNPHLDGGLCENLPTEELLNEPSLGDVIAISFEPKKQEIPKGPLSLAARMLELSIENSVHRAIRDVGEESVCHLKTDLRTFDFSTVCARGFHDDPYGRVRLETRTWLEDWIRQRTTNKRRVATQLPAHELVTRLGSVYHALKSEVEVQRATMIVIAHELESREKANEMFNFRVLRPKTELRCWSSGLVLSGILVDSGEWTVRDSSGAMREDFIPIPMRDSSLPDNFQSVALFFRTPLKAGGEHLVSRNSRLLDAFPRLLQTGEDDMFHTNTGEHVVRESDLVLLVPKNWKVSNVRFDGDVSGQEIPGVTLESLYDGYIKRNGMKAHGWRAVDVLPGKTFRVSFSARPT